MNHLLCPACFAHYPRHEEKCCGHGTARGARCVQCGRARLETDPYFICLGSSAEHRLSFEEALGVMRAIIEWARVLHHLYRDAYCEGCKRSYHPRMGEPPDESVEETETTPGCHHGHFRDMHAYWNPATLRYEDD